MNDHMATAQKSLIRVLSGETLERPPVWLMRQAGRYLPEYRATREKAGGFLNLCYTPELAAEVTLQPIRRFGFDAAILFADILLLPQALGMELWFETGEGPRLTPIVDTDVLKPIDEIHETLNPIYETVKILRAELPVETTLIGFAGAPWTVATYMIAGRGTPDQAPAHALMKKNPDAFDRIIDHVAEGTIAYLSAQIKAGAEVVKIFDSWAGSLTGDAFLRACVTPTVKIVKRLNEMHPEVPVIGFPRGSDEAEIIDFARKTGVKAVAIGQSVDPSWAKENLQGDVAVQGNLDPRLMVTGGDELRRASENLIEILGSGPFIFNLGHGITPDADPRNVEALVKIVKG